MEIIFELIKDLPSHTEFPIRNSKVSVMEEEETFRNFENDWKCRVLGEGENLRHELMKKLKTD